MSVNRTERSSPRVSTEPNIPLAQGTDRTREGDGMNAGVRNPPSATRIVEASNRTLCWGKAWGPRNEYGMAL